MTDTAKREEAARLYEFYLELEKADGTNEQVDAAWEKFAALKVDLRVNLDTLAVIRCAVTGTPITSSDRTVEVLRSALPAKQEKAA